MLVTADETSTGRGLHAAIVQRAAGAEVEVLVVAPTLTARRRHWFADDAAAHRAAEARLVHCLGVLWSAGLDARGLVGGADVLRAIEHGLAEFRADELVITTHPHSASHRHARRLAERARVRFGIPTALVVVDAAVESAAA